MPRFNVETVATPDVTLDGDSAGDEVDGQDEEVIVKRTFYLNRFRRRNEREREELRQKEAAELVRVQSDESIAWEYKGSGPVKFFAHELSLRSRLRRVLTRNPNARLISTFADLVLKTVVCLVYVVRVVLDDPDQYACNGFPCGVEKNVTNATDAAEGDASFFSSSGINWHVIIWVNRPLPLWAFQVFLAIVTFVKAILFSFVAMKGHRFEQIFHAEFILEFVCSFPFIVTLCYPDILKDLFVPCFLNAWLAKMALEKLFYDLHLTRQKFQTISVTLSQQLLILSVSLICLIFITICGIQHIQRSSLDSPLTMFKSFYFVIVTFSTVGYGDISPDLWLSQLFMILMICVAFAFFPRQIEKIASTWLERQKAGGEYSKQKAARNKHVVVCCKHLVAESIMDFLTEFYAHPKLEDDIVVLLSSDDLDSSMQVIMRDPKWAHRVIHMRGSALKDTDLRRCRIREAEACFLMAHRNTSNKAQADRHTILRSWAVKDFAPKCKQYIQLLNAENKMHVKFAEHVVCEDEFKYALLANNCLYPGLSTLVTLLVHTSKGHKSKVSSEGWLQTYSRHSGNEIYHIQLGKSRFFSQYENKKFTEASYDAHQRFGVSLVAVLDTTLEEPCLQLNPGPSHILKSTDYCFYMSIAKEEYSRINPEALKPQSLSQQREKNMQQRAHEIQAFLQEADDDDDEEADESVFNTITSQLGQKMLQRIELGVIHEPDHIENPEEVLMNRDADTTVVGGVSSQGQVLQKYSDMGQEEFVKGPPPVTLYVGTKRTICHLMKERRPYCCLEWGKSCNHCKYKSASNERWQNQLIIISVEHASNGIYNFIVPLRSEFIGMNSLRPIILLFDETPSKMFLETIAYFPLVYWMKGSLLSVDDLLRAGINKASHLVIVNRERMEDAFEESMADSETVVAIQTILKLFPNANIITELSQASNMKFLRFKAHDECPQTIHRLEQQMKADAGPNLSHIFRLPFAGGQVFSSSMLDTLLYQTFVKGYLITFVRLLLGIDAEENSGHLSSIRVNRSTLAHYHTYGELYQGLCTTTGEIPIAVYRTEHRTRKTPENNNKSTSKMSKRMVLKQYSLMDSTTSKQHWSKKDTEQADISDLVRNRMKSLDQSLDDYCVTEQKRFSLSYIILNPSPRRKLRNGDIVYVIQPSSMSAVPSKVFRRNHRLRRSWSPKLQKQEHTDDDYRCRTHSLSEVSPDNPRLVNIILPITPLPKKKNPHCNTVFILMSIPHY
ncbi:hypothetical protein ScPMuIL_008124 [Solemya velum]